jgi:hypothetical protein
MVPEEGVLLLRQLVRDALRELTEAQQNAVWRAITPRRLQADRLRRRPR